MRVILKEMFAKPIVNISIWLFILIAVVTATLIAHGFATTEAIGLSVVVGAVVIFVVVAAKVVQSLFLR